MRYIVKPKKVGKITILCVFYENVENEKCGFTNFVEFKRSYDLVRLIYRIVTQDRARKIHPDNTYDLEHSTDPRILRYLILSTS